MWITFRGNREVEAVVKKGIVQFPVSQSVKDVPLHGSFVWQNGDTAPNLSILLTPIPFKSTL